jgi:sulfoquinovose isomerase
MPWPDEAPHHRWLEAEADRLLAFSRNARHPAGGFAWLDDAGLPLLERPVELWITCRMTHVFSLGHLLGRPGCGPLADHGLQALKHRFRDPQHGGWYAAVSDDGPLSTDKSAYEHAFVVLAAASAATAGRPGARDLLEEALTVVIDRFWDDDHGMVVERWDEQFADLDAYRGINANMHTVEAFLAAADTTGDHGLRERALRITTRVVHELAESNRWRIPEHFNASWQPLLDYNIDTPAQPFRPFGATIGHWLEWARLSLHLHAAIGPESPAWLLDDARHLFQAAIEEGWAVDGADGFIYTVDWDGRPVVRERMHWVAAEATATAAVLHALTGEQQYADWYTTFWDHIADVFIDHRVGSWRHELDSRNRPSGTVWQGKPDTYHAYQATLIPRLPAAPSMATALRRSLLHT